MPAPIYQPVELEYLDNAVLMRVWVVPITTLDPDPQPVHGFAMLSYEQAGDLARNLAAMARLRGGKDIDG